MRLAVRTALVLAGVTAAGWALLPLILPDADRQSRTVRLADGDLELTGPGWEIEPGERPDVVRLHYGSCRSTSGTGHVQVRTPFGVLHTSGRFHATVERDGERLRLRATCDDGSIRFEGLELRAGQSVERPLARAAAAAPRPQPTPARIAGRCIGPDGAATDAELSLIAGGAVIARTTASADGRFAFERVSGPGPMHVVASHLDRVAGARAAAEMTLPLGFPTSLQGFVVDERGAPIDSATVDLLATDATYPRGAIVGTTRVDTAGRFAIGGLPRILVAVRISPDDGPPSHHLDVDLRGEPRLATFPMLAARTVRGTVRTATDAPGHGARVWLDVAGHPIATADCEDTGRFEIPYRVLGSPARPTVELRATLDDAVARTAIGWARQPDDAGIPIRLAPSETVTPRPPPAPAPDPGRDRPALRTAASVLRGSIQGRCVGAGATPIRFHVLAVGSSGTHRMDVADATGRFTLGELPEGRYRLIAIGSDGSGATLDGVAVEPLASTRVGPIALERAATLRVIAANEDDVHVDADATLEPIDAVALPPRLGMPAGGAWPPEAVRFQGFRPGRYRLRVFPRSKALGATEEIIDLGGAETFLRVICRRRTSP